MVSMSRLKQLMRKPPTDPKCKAAEIENKLLLTDRKPYQRHRREIIFTLMESGINQRHDLILQWFC